jgi:hypothetical protein
VLANGDQSMDSRIQYKIDIMVVRADLANTKAIDLVYLKVFHDSPLLPGCERSRTWFEQLRLADLSEMQHPLRIRTD